MKKRITIFATAFIVVTIVLVFTRQTILGYLDRKFGNWDEDKLLGKSISELEHHFAERGRPLTPADPEGLRGRTGIELALNEQVVKFRMGTDYSWFGVGRAQNIGYLILSGTPTNEPVVVRIVRSVEIDSN